MDSDVWTSLSYRVTPSVVGGSQMVRYVKFVIVERTKSCNSVIDNGAYVSQLNVCPKFESGLSPSSGANPSPSGGVYCNCYLH